MKLNEKYDDSPRLTIYIWGLSLLTFIFFIVSCSNDTETEIINYFQESDHFKLYGTSKITSPAEMDEVMEKSELLFADISDFLGDKHKTTSKINIHFEGDLNTQGSFVGFDGVHLFRYPEPDGGYLAVLAHEITHAFIAPWFIEMEAWDWPTYRFYDEGFVEYVAQKVDSLKHGFPFYGYPEDLVVGDLVVTDKYIPCEQLRSHHEQYNDKCNLQAYPQRTSWIRHVDEVFGRDILFSIMFPDSPTDDELVYNLTGFHLTELDSMWENWIIQRYYNIEDANTKAASFYQRISWFTPCDQ